MSNTIRPEQLAKAIAEEMEKYSDFTYDMIMQQTQSVAKETVKELKQTSPVGLHTKNRGEYAKSWTYGKKNVKAGREYHAVIYARSPHYRLTHLLEYGHRLVRNGKEYGHADAKPHIKKAEENAIRKYEEEIIKAIEKGIIPK